MQKKVQCLMQNEMPGGYRPGRCLLVSSLQFYFCESWWSTLALSFDKCNVLNMWKLTGFILICCCSLVQPEPCSYLSFICLWFSIGRTAVCFCSRRIRVCVFDVWLRYCLLPSFLCIVGPMWILVASVLWDFFSVNGKKSPLDVLQRQMLKSLMFFLS